MKKTSRKLLMAGAALGLAAASTVGSTYAWFTVNGSSEITNVNMTVAGGSGISLKKHTDSKFGLSLDLASDFSSRKWLPCTPASTTGVADGSFKDVDVAKTISTYHSTVAADPSTTSTNYELTGVLADTSKYVYTLDLDVRLTEGYDFTIKVTTPQTGDAVTVTNGKNGNTDAKEVIRVAVVTYSDGKGAVEATKTATTYKLSNRSSSRTSDEATAAFNLAYGVNIASNPDTLADIASLVTSPGALVGSHSANLVDGYYTERVGIVVWYEGTDWACSNQIFAQTVSFGLTVTPVEKTDATKDL